MTASPAPSSRWKCTVAYDGTAFTGWQSQTGGKSVQDVIERRLAEIFAREVRVHGSGRTDAGVHARGQVFHFDADWTHGAAKLLAAFRTGLPPTIQVSAARRMAADFHARFSATGKIYQYEIRHGGGGADPFEFPFCWAMPHTLDIAAMRAAAERLVGRHDFTSFSALKGEERKDNVRTLRRLDVTARGPRVRVVAEADGFLYKMVRSLVGALVSVGQGKLTPDEIAAILRERRRTHRVKTAPPEGLCLMKVFYP
jgi:tRNA pseudouridine38-40 synthase